MNSGVFPGGEPPQNSEVCPVCDGDCYTADTETSDPTICERCQGVGFVRGAKIDLAKDFEVAIGCGCVVIFTGRSGHKKTTSKPQGRCPKYIADVKHVLAVVAQAKRFRCTQMERIE
jgi:hypothetical protein